MENIIKNYLNYIQNICIIKKRLMFYSHKPRKQMISQIISDVCAQSQWRKKVIGKNLFTFKSKITDNFFKKSLKL